MALDFFEMMKQEQEKQKAQNTPITKQNKELQSVTPKTEEKPSVKKKEGKKDELETSTVPTFDEQLKKAGPQEKVIVRYLLMKYPDIKEKMEHPYVSIEGMYEYIQSQARKHAKNGAFITVPQELIDAFPEDAEKEGYLSDDIVYGWGRHYYDEHGKVS
ncbi:Cas9 inhibitor AcrIIA9 family protein [Candidatus Stoquefichus massiliensis]|uniref:Cas9 inhibitor AcrIIA9 family protein n=1 Tax=Candidatus Stoquefichus massiliensis TaxID=1470350 RepID=UPI000485297A|nr:Cas9 inhibitor AcrIIA9 family protein [Candidatus Stoquefichus massiliensis]